MNWPDSIVIVDDQEFAFKMKEILEDLSWINNPAGFLETAPWGELDKEDILSLLQERITELPVEIRELAKRSPKWFADKIHAVMTNTMEDVRRAEEHLTKNGTSIIAILDFEFTLANVDIGAYLDGRYSEMCKKPWDIADSHRPRGGIYFSKLFEPKLEYPTRLLCPATVAKPNRLERVTNGAQTDAVAINTHRGRFDMALLALSKWVEIQSRHISPLGEIWRKATQNGWFLNNAIGSESLANMPHEVSENTNLHGHRSAVVELLDLDLPEAWWHSWRSANLIHESLKRMCGVYYCGSPELEAKYNLCVGSAFFVSLLALRDSHQLGDCSKFTKDVNTFEGLSKITSRLLPIQDQSLAREGAGALYFLLKSLFEPSKHDSEVQSASLSVDGRLLEITFTGLGYRNLADTLNSLLAAPEDISHQLRRGREDNSRLIPSLLRLWRSMATSSKGFGSPGTIHLEENKLRIWGSYR